MPPAPAEPDPFEAAKTLFAPEHRLRDQRSKSTADRLYPKPDEQDIIALRSALEGIWDEWRYGTMNNAATDPDTLIGTASSIDSTNPHRGVPGLVRTRQMRYHRDTQPAKYARYMNSAYRWFSNFVQTEINRSVALATRNAPKISVPPGNRDPDAKDRSDKESRWAQYLWPTLERQSGQPHRRMLADALFEGGLSGIEVFLTDGYDEVDVAKKPEEDDAAYMARTDDALQQASARRLPIGIRVPDALTILPEFDDFGLCRLLIIEDKPYRTVYADLTKKLKPEDLEKLTLPTPGTPGWPQDYYSQGWGTPAGNVTTIRYLDRRWYGFIVGGKWQDGPVEHHMPGIPFICGFGNVTSSDRIAERYQGVAWPMVEQEQIINDVMSQTTDIYFTYGRPKPYVETMIGGDLRDPATGPQTVKLGNVDEAPELGLGQRLRDAFEGFGPRIPTQMLNIMLQIRQASGMSPVSAGVSPGSDPSGFAVNTLQAADQMQYEILIDNYGDIIGRTTDFIRNCIKYGPISDKVFVPVMNQNGEVEYLGLGPDEITDMPCTVVVDPQNDVNRLATRQSLIAGNQAGYIPRSTVQQQGFGIDDTDMADNEIADDVADQQLLGMALDEAKRQIAMQIAPPPPPPSGLVGPDGNPISSTGSQAGDANELRTLGGMPREDRGTGRMARSDGGQPDAVTSSNQANAGRATGGQAPANQGAGAQVPYQ